MARILGMPPKPPSPPKPPRPPKPPYLPKPGGATGRSEVVLTLVAERVLICISYKKQLKLSIFTCKWKRIGSPKSDRTEVWIKGAPREWRERFSRNGYWLRYRYWLWLLTSSSTSHLFVRRYTELIYF